MYNFAFKLPLQKDIAVTGKRYIQKLHFQINRGFNIASAVYTVMYMVDNIKLVDIQMGDRETKKPDISHDKDKGHYQIFKYVTNQVLYN
jgi:hypothetical protein